jgi:carbon storage regulator
MLVLTRQRDQRIMIGDDVVITVIEIRRGHVRLGIDAPANVPVHREEIYNALKEQERTSKPDQRRDPNGQQPQDAEA